MTAAACLGPYFAGRSIVAPGTVMGTTTGAGVRRAKFGKRAALEAERRRQLDAAGEADMRCLCGSARLSACGVEGWPPICGEQDQPVTERVPRKGHPAWMELRFGIASF